MEEKNLPPNLDVILSDLKRDIFATLNCVQIGKVAKVNKDDQTVEVQIQIKQPLTDGSSVSIPLLVDVPYFILQGGSAYIDMPITAGDYCLVLFNDRDIDIWWTTNGSEHDPNTSRKHSFSDAIALVGVNPKTAVRDFDGNNMRFFGDEIHLNGDSKTFVTHAALDTALQTFVTALNLLLSFKKDDTLQTPGSLTIDISAAETTTIKTGG
jgi:hypothetical protein